MQPPAFLDGVPAGEVAKLLSGLERRRFPAGATVIAQHDALSAVYMIESGSAEVLIADSNGGQHRIGDAAPGTVLGEMSLFTGRPASATVRALIDLEVFVLRHEEVHRFAASYPVIYRNLGMMLSERLSRSNSLALLGAGGRSTMLLDHGSPPVLGYALACSLAWHLQRPALLILLDRAVPPELSALTVVDEGAAPELRTKDMPAAAARLVVTSPDGRFAPDNLARTLEDLCQIYAHILIQAPDEQRLSGEGPRLHLTGCVENASQWTRAASQLILHGWTDEAARLPRPDAHGVLSVPKLGVPDEQALRKGILPANTAAGRALGWMARHLAGLKVGLALGAGGYRGYAHIGVLQALERAGVVPDYIAGTSVGAVVGALHAFGFGPAAAASALDRATAVAFRVTFPVTALLSNRGLRSLLQAFPGDQRIEDAYLPLAVTAADIMTGQEVIFRRGPVWRALLASTAIPGIYPPQQIGSRILVDGGVLQPVPSRAAADLGADMIIGVKLASSPSAATIPNGEARTRDRPLSIFGVITRSIEIMQSKISADTAAAATIVIEPEFRDRVGRGLRNFAEGRRFIELGEAAAESALPRIAAELPWISG